MVDLHGVIRRGTDMDHSSRNGSPCLAREVYFFRCGTHALPGSHKNRHRDLEIGIGAIVGIDMQFFFVPALGQAGGRLETDLSSPAPLGISAFLTQRCYQVARACPNLENL
jgi:hypothetical protein